MIVRNEAFAGKVQGPGTGWIQRLCPAPNRLVQQLILEKGLKNGLDIGCGEHSLLTPLRAYGFHSTGLDIWPDMIEEARLHNRHDDYILGDVRTAAFDRKFDVVVLNHVIEHLPRDEGMGLLRRLETISTKMLVIGTPNGFLEQTAYDGNPFQRHLSGWFPGDFESRGYTVFGSGLRCLRGPEGRSRWLPRTCVRTIDRLLAWYLLRRPRASFSILAVRYLDENGCPRQL
jgi:hypothetical protein